MVKILRGIIFGMAIVLLIAVCGYLLQPAEAFGAYTYGGDVTGTLSGHNSHVVTKSILGKVVEDSVWSNDWSKIDGTLKMHRQTGEIHKKVVRATPDTIYLEGYSTLVMKTNLTTEITRNTMIVRGDKPGSNKDITFNPQISEEDWKEMNPAI